MKTSIKHSQAFMISALYVNMSLTVLSSKKKGLKHLQPIYISIICSGTLKEGSNIVVRYFKCWYY